jgi:Core-2/I-Branching enzyme
MRTPILYCILLHNNPKQTLRLLRSIYNSVDQFVVHVDSRADPAYKRLICAFGAIYKNAHVLSEYRSGWGSFNLVRATISALRYAVESNRDWQHVVILSGTHLPIRPFGPFQSSLVSGKSYFTWKEMKKFDPTSEERWVQDMWNRIEYHYTEQEGKRMLRGAHVGRPKFDYVVGYQWVILAREHVAFALRSEPDPIRVRLECSNVADESFFQTVLFNSPYKAECVWHESTTCFWTPGQWSPKVLSLEEYAALSEKPKTQFVRKIADDLGDEREVERMIDRVLGGVERPDLLSAVSALAHDSNV